MTGAPHSFVVLFSERRLLQHERTAQALGLTLDGLLLVLLSSPLIVVAKLALTGTLVLITVYCIE